MSPITRDPSTRTDETEAPAGTAAAARADDGRSTRWEDHREARRAELVRVARRVVHHEGPDVSMDDIAAAAGTSKSIVYRYFTDKDGLQLAVAAAVVTDIRDALDAAATGASTPRDALRGMVDTYLSMIESSPHVYAFVTRGGSVGHFLDSVTELVAVPFVRALGVEGDGTPEGPDADWARLWAAGAVGFVRGAGERWLAARDQPDADREDVATRVAAWLWAGPVGVLSRERTARPVEATDATDAARPPG
ncbi:TetR/AcrR family transcriptional regulator [Cellulomonas endometrii]|uniref:TetR/AcrR family transcriptional regulator n=1 Tax=Cellulomonas endometrii TaxID=3036301 RepID=UPI0024AE7EA2|nr:TetR/AcrR family transcriptional regulator [Cellulomonas endometrii]